MKKIPFEKLTLGEYIDLEHYISKPDTILEMLAVLYRKFTTDIFISYAHIDNQPLTPDQRGWITRFHETLEALLSMRMGDKARVWRDNKLQGNDVFADEIVERLAGERHARDAAAHRRARVDRILQPADAHHVTALLVVGVWIE